MPIGAMWWTEDCLNNSRHPDPPRVGRPKRDRRKQRRRRSGH